jgi:hypothetical protein
VYRENPVRAVERQAGGGENIVSAVGTKCSGQLGAAGETQEERQGIISGEVSLFASNAAPVHSALAAGEVMQAFAVLLQGDQAIVVQDCTTPLARCVRWEDVAQKVCVALLRILRRYGRVRSCGRGSFAWPALGAVTVRPNTGMSGGVSGAYGRRQG